MSETQIGVEKRRERERDREIRLPVAHFLLFELNVVKLHISLETNPFRYRFP